MIGSFARMITINFMIGLIVLTMAVAGVLRMLGM